MIPFEKSLSKLSELIVEIRSTEFKCMVVERVPEPLTGGGEVVVEHNYFIIIVLYSIECYT